MQLFGIDLGGINPASNRGTDNPSAEAPSANADRNGVLGLLTDLSGLLGDGVKTVNAIRDGERLGDRPQPVTPPRSLQGAVKANLPVLLGGAVLIGILFWLLKRK